MTPHHAVPPPGPVFNFAQHLIERNGRRADKVAFIDDLGTLSYGQLAERIRRLLTERASSRRVIALACVGAAGALMFPPVVALAPAIALADSAHCDGQCH